MLKQKSSSTSSSQKSTGRVDHPTGKQQYVDKEDNTKEERPTSRVDHPTGKQQYVDKEDDTKKERPTSRVDHPTGKQQYLDDDSKTECVDVGTVTVTYTIKVLSHGKDKSIPVCSVYAESQKEEAYAVAERLISSGAKIEMKKNITVEIKVI